MITPCVSRLLADQTFREGMIALDVRWVTRQILYYAVRMFGMWTYEKYRKAEALSKGKTTCP
jgi:hypothetical protein